MAPTLQYIDDYFTGQLPDDERARFEMRCESDNDFAQEVADYLSIRNTLKADLAAARKHEFDEMYTQMSAKTKKERPLFIRMLPYISTIAVCFILYLGWVF